MSKLYPARVRVAVGVAPRPALLRFSTESPPAAQHLRRDRSPWYGPIRHWFFPIGSRSRCRGGAKATLDPRSYSKDGQTI
jgi:hypothetical protein